MGWGVSVGEDVWYVCGERGERKGEKLGDRNTGKRYSLGSRQGS